MDNTHPLRRTARLAICVSVAALLTACGGGGGGIETEDPILLDATAQASDNSQPALDPGTPEFTPSLGAALPIQYQDPGQDLSSSTDFIGAQWEHMQTCLLVSAQEPIVVVVDGDLEPKDSNDDVVRHIDGQMQASSHVTNTSVTIQVRAQDFDGTLGKPGAYLRSIMGRYLWLANGLAERDYPYNCAKGE